MRNTCQKDIECIRERDTGDLQVPPITKSKQESRPGALGLDSNKEQTEGVDSKVIHQALVTTASRGGISGGI